MSNTDRLRSCITTPGQQFCYNGACNSPQMGHQCAIYIPTQEEGLLIDSNFRFSDGYSLNYDLYDARNATNVPSSVTVEMGGAHAQGVPSTFECPPSGYYHLPYPQKPPEGFFPTNGTVHPPQIPNGFNGPLPFTPSFFASNSSFVRIPLSSNKSIFRRRKRGDALSEWSNAFLNEPDECAPCLAQC